ncbi:YolD-like family protein [Bacillus sp. NEB1478]|uniref:YolD-like family protein n=1 Tax=Bacillus sp. NEB1478 TaxID=3073816 RepID=UPI002872EB76|nr:YolD-like family protein [Bacillus sp. NEB1478]WNB93429.1 YolD-like family protein [Bacillus sp. NEB1478]
MTLRDRGTIKWTSMMLPEHVKELRKYINEDYYDIPEPIIDEQQMDEMSDLILEAMEYNKPVSFTVYKNKRLITINGFTHYIDQNKKQLKIMDSNSELHTISFSSIKKVIRD